MLLSYWSFLGMACMHLSKEAWSWVAQVLAADRSPDEAWAASAGLQQAALDKALEQAAPSKASRKPMSAAAPAPAATPPGPAAHPAAENGAPSCLQP